MSNLCYNCGACHLPRACTAPLQYCELCANLGHTYNFCPLGVRNKDPSYQFWALCHNCDQWHLPHPCQTTLYKCTRCGHLGHKEFFCPIAPVARNPQGPSQTEEKAGIKRRHTDGQDVNQSGGVHYEANISVVHPEIVRNIRHDAAQEVLQLVGLRYDFDQILKHMQRDISQNHFTGGAERKDSVLNSTNGAANQSTMNASFLSPNAVAVATEANQIINQQSPTTPISAMKEVLQQPFTNEAVQNNNSYENSHQVDETAQPAKKAKRTPSIGRCAACKKAKKRCTHMESAANGNVVANNEAATTANGNYGVTNNGASAAQESHYAPNPMAFGNTYMQQFNGGGVMATNSVQYTQMTDFARSGLQHLLNPMSDDNPAQAPNTTTFTASNQDLTIPTLSTNVTEQATAGQPAQPVISSENNSEASAVLNDPSADVSNDGQGKKRPTRKRSGYIVIPW